MNELEWRNHRDSRTIRYAGRRLEPNRWINLVGDARYLETYAGQVATITLVNLLSRMTPSVALQIPSTSIVQPLPWAGRNLPDFLLEIAYAIDPYGRFAGTHQADGYTISVGGVGPFVAHGSGWSGYIGQHSSPITDVRMANPFGAAFAALATSAHVFSSGFRPLTKSAVFNTLRWTNEITNASDDEMLNGLPAYLGSMWSVGVGSVGTAILYFLTLLTRGFSPVLIDPDVVQIHNLDRSPVFTDADVGYQKVDAVEKYLRAIGVSNVLVENAALHETDSWRNREQGTPDLLFSAANEQDVRYHIEASWPPIQVYGTTGRNWQASLLRHVPLVDPCSLCLFPPDTSKAETVCATDSRPAKREGLTDNVDAALPFLSFAAGLMAAAEAVKLHLHGFPFSANRVTLNTRPFARIVSASSAQRVGCSCSSRSSAIHRRMIGGSLFAHLSAI